MNGCIRFVHLGQDLIDGGLKKVLDRILREVHDSNPRLVFVDSFRSIAREHAVESANDMDLQHFVQALALYLTSYEATTFLIGEYLEPEAKSNPVFTVADGIFWLHQSEIRNSVVRRLQVVKIRGQKEIPGFHTVRISSRGVSVFPRLPNPPEPSAVPAGEKRALLRTGAPGVDEMLGGGIPAGYSVMLVGPSGSGKTVLSSQFIMEGINKGEPSVIAVFEKRPEDYLKSNVRGMELADLSRQGRIKMVYIRPLDLSVDETLEQIRAEVIRLHAKRVVIDSLSGFELALAPAFRDDFRESLYRMVGALTTLGVTVVLTVEISDTFDELRLSPHGISFLTDGIILQRYTELAGKLQKVMSVVKLRARPHSRELRAYEIDEKGIVVGDTLTDYQGILAGNATRTKPAKKRRR